MRMGLSLTDPRQQVVITGLGVIAPNGADRDTFWNAVVEGRSGIDWISSFDTSDTYCKIGGEVCDFDAADYMPPKTASRTSRFSAFAVAAARQAVEDAGLDEAPIDPYKRGAVFGTTLASMGNIGDEMYFDFVRSGAKGLDLLGPSQLAAHAATANVFVELGFKGPNTTSGAGCVAAIDAVATAVAMLRSGQADVMVAGGTEACLSIVGMSLLCAQKVLTRHNDPPQQACRPYDDTRDGLVLSEGAGAVVLETAAHAMERGAHIYGQVMGYSSTTEAYHLLLADPGGEELAVAFRRAMLQGKISPEEVDYVCAHGISNRQYDIAETQAVKQVLGRRAYNVPMSSIKSTTGQPFAAGGAWQLLASCMAIQTGLIPPTINYRVPDPECDLDYVPNYARRARVETVMVNSHSVGGTHGCLIMRKFEG
jgi:3-oxoacyl-[acyl-carrier-protein] synthase II